MDITEVSLTILYLLQEAKIPLNIDQICNALQDNYTYIENSIALTNLIDKNLVLKTKTPLCEEYSITVEGRISVAHLKNNVRGSVRNNIIRYVEENIKELALSSNVFTKINSLDGGKYLVQLRAYDKELDMNDIVLIVNDETEAQLITSNWTNHADEAIAALYSVLIREK